MNQLLTSFSAYNFQMLPTPNTNAYTTPFQTSNHQIVSTSSTTDENVNKRSYSASPIYQIQTLNQLARIQPTLSADPTQIFLSFSQGIFGSVFIFMTCLLIFFLIEVHVLRFIFLLQSTLTMIYETNFLNETICVLFLVIYL